MQASDTLIASRILRDSLQSNVFVILTQKASPVGQTSPITACVAAKSQATEFGNSDNKSAAPLLSLANLTLLQAQISPRELEHRAAEEHSKKQRQHQHLFFEQYQLCQCNITNVLDENERST